MLSWVYCPRYLELDAGELVAGQRGPEVRLGHVAQQPAEGQTDLVPVGAGGAFVSAFVAAFVAALLAALLARRRRRRRRGGGRRGEQQLHRSDDAVLPGRSRQARDLGLQMAVLHAPGGHVRADRVLHRRAARPGTMYSTGAAHTPVPLSSPPLPLPLPRMPPGQAATPPGGPRGTRG